MIIIFAMQQQLMSSVSMPLSSRPNAIHGKKPVGRRTIRFDNVMRTKFLVGESSSCAIQKSFGSIFSIAFVGN